jgi:hypothetical protein
LILLLFALFIFPLAVYCTIIGMINRRTRPLVVSGTWDFLGILLATSLLLLFLGPVLGLSASFRDNLSELPFQRGFGSLADATETLLLEWWLAYLLYYILLLGGAVYLLWLRRNTTVIYNVEQRTVEAALARLFLTPSPPTRRYLPRLRTTSAPTRWLVKLVRRKWCANLRPRRASGNPCPGRPPWWTNR